jgi:hypothetical protein
MSALLYTETAGVQVPLRSRARNGVCPLVYTEVDREDYNLLRKLGARLSASTQSVGQARRIVRYVTVTLPGRKRVSLHRFLTDAPYGLTVDHINGMTLDNRR